MYCYNWISENQTPKKNWIKNRKFFGQTRACGCKSPVRCVRRRRCPALKETVNYEHRKRDEAFVLIELLAPQGWGGVSLQLGSVNRGISPGWQLYNVGLGGGLIG